MFWRALIIYWPRGALCPVWLIRRYVAAVKRDEHSYGGYYWTGRLP